jgi:ComF family protein
MKSGIVTYLKDFINLLYPDACFSCQAPLISGEKYICTKCLYEIPRTNYHLEPENEVAQIFWGRCNLTYACSFMFFKKKSKYQKLIHKLKYHDMYEIGFELGNLYGIDLKKADWIKEVDFLVPVPLHPKRLRERGYNQSEWIAKGMEKRLTIPVNTDNLIRTKATSTQTKKSRVERWENVESIFTVVDHETFNGKHILLIDDVVTTGSTLEACANALLDVENIKVSIATIGFAKD